ncbi:metal-dependent hydrolase [Pseudoclavibacter sp. AY1F1]|uniref:M48 metallopeptidase family protein n=1 Tax=Pseudoclavibacter sp. AY1F1 TaxID=2080583 RepID=UPI000CE722C7|nr:M48 family metallopeptidase [Pseudoclavibacter sp. AY1F1]PPF44840.1 metal-dependent hydrolase [Pseudoclavibacter sp. AY1F1]
MAAKSPLYPEDQLRRRAMSWAITIKVNPEQIQVRRLPGKWGSCAPDGIVTFADDLANEAEPFQDYVIVHELLHLRHRHHGKQFKALMNALVPDWRDLEKQSRRSADREPARLRATGWATDADD